MKIGIDVDDVTADSTSGLGPWLRQRGFSESSIGLVLQQRTDRSLPLPVGLDLFAFYSDPEACENFLPVKDAVNGIVQLIADGHEVVFITHRPPSTDQATRRWLERWGLVSGLAEPRVVFADRTSGHKQGHNLDVLVDDKMNNLVSVVSEGGYGILFDQPWNRHARLYPQPKHARRIFRAASWWHVGSLISRLDGLLDASVPSKSLP